MLTRRTRRRATGRSMRRATKRLGFKLSHARRVVKTVAEIEAGGNTGGAGDAGGELSMRMDHSGGCTSAAHGGGVRGCDAACEGTA